MPRERPDASRITLAADVDCAGGKRHVNMFLAQPLQDAFPQFVPHAKLLGKFLHAIAHS